MRRNHPELTVHYTTAERFTSEFVGALRRDGPELFKARYRELDALLIDDVQVLEGKQRTEEEFVHTFNALHAAGKQIVLSSDRPPEALSRLAERLRDRFRWGLQVELERPDLRTQDRAAVAPRLRQRPRPAPRARVLQEIATRVPENVRVLEGAMTRVLAVSSLLSEPLSMPLVRRALDGGEAGAPRPTAEPPTLEAIQDAVCEITGLTQGGAALAAALAARRPRSPARDVPGPRAHPALADRDRPRLRPRPHHRPARDPRRVLAPRARLGDRRRPPQGPLGPGDEAAGARPTNPPAAATIHRIRGADPRRGLRYLSQLSATIHNHPRIRYI